MKSILLSALLFVCINNAQANTSQESTISLAPATECIMEVQTFATTSAELSNGSVYIRSTNCDWQLTISCNSAVVNTFHITGCDTFISGLAMGCYTFSYSNVNGSTESVSKIISGPAPIVGSFKSHKLNRPNENAIAFTNYSTGAVSFAWDFGDGEQSAEISPMHIYHSPGTYIVSLKAYNRSGAISTVTYMLVVPDSHPTGMK